MDDKQLLLKQFKLRLRWRRGSKRGQYTLVVVERCKGPAEEKGWSSHEERTTLNNNTLCEPMENRGEKTNTVILGFISTNANILITTQDQLNVPGYLCSDISRSEAECLHGLLSPSVADTMIAQD